MIRGWIIGIGAALLAALLFLARSLGVSQERARARRAATEEARRGRQARQDVRHDPEKRADIRRRFTR